ncbi:hypothetical protein JI721_15780 [Alicyclobacillus cycloheptanicus]|uniref:Uncharacterized protein n=1 Tax=Alicyclobacillus cycloheptanicus TaxID=1457 RepID=A0ABT9XDP9_9BACL|nr:hypothetical protein [Alicyclobacillus cycloheptanicus]MDQ0188400.1 hypothetical protein [Alicyclobacillus cycloheptanicus]WDM01105.1 hypothetical protein JI721_15780 [Alicyclobacillus cycloheptanicus]
MAHFIDFHIGGLRVGSLDNSSGIFTGQNLQYGWRHSEKDNNAAPRVAGDHNVIQGASYSVVDPDLLDTWVQKAPPLANQPVPSPALARYWALRKRQLRSASRRRSPFDWDI